MAGRRRDLDRVELLVFVALAAVSMWVVALNLWWAAGRGLVWTGIDGEFPIDQMQYLAWVQDSSRHLLVSDLFGLRATAHDYLQPMVAISGGLTALGMAPWLAVIVWKPVAFVAIFLASRAYCHRLLSARGQRRAALVLGLFAATGSTLGDEWIPFLSWGYLYGLVAVAAMVGALVAYDRTRSEGRRRWAAPALGLLAGWLHPWQGELLILIVIGGELWCWRGSARSGLLRWIGLPTATVAATALPLLYYAILQRADPSWRLAETVTRHHVWSLAGALWPLALLLAAAALAYRRRPTSVLGAATRVWPFAALIVWTLTNAGLGATPLHAWMAITLPLAVLAVDGVSGSGGLRLPGRRLLATAVVAALTIPGSIHLMSAVPAYIGPPTHNQNLITASEYQAFGYLASLPQPGGVLGGYALGDAVPSGTGRHTYGGDFRWSGLDFEADERAAWRLLHGQLTASRARRFVLGTGARFVLADCNSHAALTRPLAAIIRAVHRFGCATVYQIRRTG